MKKKIVLIIAIIVIAVSSFALLGGCSHEFTEGDNLVSIAASTKGQTMKGFGASSAWWSQIIGEGANKDVIANYLYGDDGMALNIYRYNIGGGSKDIEGVDQYWELDRLTESFLKGETYSGTTHDDLMAFVSNPANYDFTKDKGAQDFLKASYALGNINEVVLFVNSPHYLMTKNGKCRNDDGAGRIDNLDSSNYDVFAKYLMVITKHFVDEGYPVKYISPINEPQCPWDANKQEGCHYEPASCAACLNAVATELKAFNSSNGTNIKIDGFESGSWRWNNKDNPSYIDQYVSNIQSYDYYSDMDYISFHSYSNPYSRKRREEFMKNIASYNIQVGMSEYCQMTSGVNLNEFRNAQFLTLVMSYDMSILKSNEWIYWIGVSNEKTYNYEDGLIYTNWWSDYNVDHYKDYYNLYTGEIDVVRLSPRYYALKHYSNFVDPGDIHLELSIENEASNLGANKLHQDDELGLFYAFKTDAGDKMPYSDKIYNAFLKPDGTVVLVYTNVVDEPILYTFKEEFKTFEAYTSTADGYLVKTEGKFNHTYTFPGNSITTLVIHP